LIRKPLIKNVLSPMYRAMFEPESGFLPQSREAAQRKRAPVGAPSFDANKAGQVSRLEKRTVVARAR
jgi:hypothetical protein